MFISHILGTTGNILSGADLLLSSPQEVARKCKMSPSEAKQILDDVCKAAVPRRIRRLQDVRAEGAEVCTTGDSRLDEALGGGIKTGLVWEVAGERCGLPFRNHSVV